jgi:hypothetical protein
MASGGEHVARTGAIYFYGVGSGVEATSTQLFATMEGNVTLTITEDEIETRGNDVIADDTETVGMTYDMTFERVHFKPTTLFENCFGITVATGSLLEDDGSQAETASIWKFTTSVFPGYKEWLFDYTRGDATNSEKNQIKIFKAKVPALTIPFTSTDWVVHDMTLRCLQNANGTIMWFMEQV